MVYLQTVTHPSINRARRRVTPLIETNTLPLSQATTWYQPSLLSVMYQTVSVSVFLRLCLSLYVCVCLCLYAVVWEEGRGELWIRQRRLLANGESSLSPLVVTARLMNTPKCHRTLQKKLIIFCSMLPGSRFPLNYHQLFSDVCRFVCVRYWHDRNVKKGF